MRRPPARFHIGLGIGAALSPLLAGCGSGSATTSAAPSASVAPGEAVPDAPPPKLLPGAKTAALAAAGDKPYDKTFDDLRFEMQLEERFRREMLTAAIEQMFGRRIRIRGFILPTAQQSGIRQFVLVRDNQECCFGPGAALYDCIFVEMQKGRTAEYSIRPVTVEGTFGFKEIIGPDGRHLAIYHLEGESVR